MEEIVKQQNQAQFTQFIERIERLEADKKEFTDGIREVYKEAKGQGFDVKVMRQIIKLRKLDPDDRAKYMFNLEKYEELAK